MSQHVFLSKEVVPLIRVLVLNTRSNLNARKRIVDHLASKYYGNILNHPKKLCRPKHIYEHPHLNYACNIFGGSMKGDKWQKD